VKLIRASFGLALLGGLAACDSGIEPPSQAHLVTVQALPSSQGGPSGVQPGRTAFVQASSPPGPDQALDFGPRTNHADRGTDIRVEEDG
jgi:hypothetical protein